jgi:hypothetical protein
MPFKNPEDEKRCKREYILRKRQEQKSILYDTSIPDIDVEWRDVVGFEVLYMISNQRIVKNKKTNYIHTLNNRSGYFSVSLTKGDQYKQERVHRLVAKAFIPNPENKPFVDHIDNNGFNNIISNLRWATNQENMRNMKCCRNSKSGVRGVYFETSQMKWRAFMMVDKKSIHIGYFKTIEEATDARKKRVNEVYGCFVHSSEKLEKHTSDNNLNIIKE